MKKIVLFLWQLPQDLLALSLLLWHRCFGRQMTFEQYKGVRYYWIEGWDNGISLGDYVILGTCYRDGLTADHEWGHTRQSLIFGPLYLLLIGLPSGLGNLWDRVAHRKWDYKRSCRWYYSQPWERWADYLGCVTRWWQK